MTIKNKTWYEFAVSWKYDMGTMTLETFKTLSEAKKYIPNTSEDCHHEVDFYFIDKWTNSDSPRVDLGFKAIRLSKEDAEDENYWLGRGAWDKEKL